MCILSPVGPSNKLGNVELLHPWQKQPTHPQYFLHVLVEGVVVWDQV